MTQPNRTQHAPSPDYSTTESTVTPALSLCPDCGDLHLALHATLKDAQRARGVDRCDTCVAAHRDELATAGRLLAAAAYPLLAGILSTRRSGGMNDPREILCDDCCECAVTYTGCVDSLDGTRSNCETCNAPGIVVVDDDEGLHSVSFKTGLSQ